MKSDILVEDIPSLKGESIHTGLRKLEQNIKSCWQYKTLPSKDWLKLSYSMLKFKNIPLIRRKETKCMRNTHAHTKTSMAKWQRK